MNQLRMSACDRELAKIGDMRKKPYAVMWSKKLDYYQENLLIRKGLYGRDNWFWIATGKRWLLWLWILRLLPKK